MKRFSMVISIFASIILIVACVSTPAPTPELTSTVTPVAVVPTSVSCTSIPSVPTPGPETPSLFPPISDSDHIRGPEDAAVIIMAYGDLQNKNSGMFANVMSQLQSELPNDVRFVSRIFPFVGRNDKAVLAAQAVEAADLQGKFWDLHDLLFSLQENWVDFTIEDFEQWMAVQASALGMDVVKFQADLKSETVVNLVQSNFETGQKFGPFGVPLIVINGEIYLGPQDLNSLRDIVGLIMLGERQFTDCPPMTVEKTKQYIATLHTEKGDVVIQLFADKAPYTVNSFVFLAQRGWYDNITFHRVIPELYAQTGDPSGTGKGTPGYFIVTEILPELAFDKPGMVAMVNSGPDTSGSQFFITYAPTPEINGQYTIFGEVLSGMDVLKQLAPRNVQPGGETAPGDKLLNVTIEER